MPSEDYDQSLPQGSLIIGVFIVCVKILKFAIIAILNAPSEDSDLPVHPDNLIIGVLIVRVMILCNSNCPKCAQ